MTYVEHFMITMLIDRSTMHISEWCDTCKVTTYLLVCSDLESMRTHKRVQHKSTVLPCPDETYERLY